MLLTIDMLRVEVDVRSGCGVVAMSSGTSCAGMLFVASDRLPCDVATHPVARAHGCRPPAASAPPAVHAATKPPPRYTPPSAAPQTAQRRRHAIVAALHRKYVIKTSER